MSAWRPLEQDGRTEAPLVVLPSLKSTFEGILPGILFARSFKFDLALVVLRIYSYQSVAMDGEWR